MLALYGLNYAYSGSAGWKGIVRTRVILLLQGVLVLTSNMATRGLHFIHSFFRWLISGRGCERGAGSASVYAYAWMHACHIFPRMQGHGFWIMLVILCSLPIAASWLPTAVNGQNGGVGVSCFVLGLSFLCSSRTGIYPNRLIRKVPTGVLLAVQEHCRCLIYNWAWVRQGLLSPKTAA